VYISGKADFGNRMNWQDLRYFLALAHHGKLAAAARELGVSPATVLRRIAHLEHALKARLFTRRGNAYLPSETGARLLKAGDSVAAEIQAVRDGIAADEDSLSGAVRMSAPEAVAMLLPACLVDLKQSHPRLSVELLVGAPSAAMARRQTDFSLRFDKSPGADLVLKDSFEISFGVYASEQYVEESGRPRALDQFEGHSLIGFDEEIDHVAPLNWRRCGGKRGFVQFRSNSLQTRLATTLAGLGLALLPTFVARSHSSLVEVFGPGEIGSLELSLLVSTRSRSRPTVAAALDHVRLFLQAQREMLAGLQAPRAQCATLAADYAASGAAARLQAR
jgi:DNA-binding transcriptional LysR family regulator